MADAAGRGDAGPPDEEGDADAAFVSGAFAGAEGHVAGDVAQDQTAIVGGEEDDGVGGETEFVEFALEAADKLSKVVRNLGGAGRAKGDDLSHFDQTDDAEAGDPRFIRTVRGVGYGMGPG